jgi:thiosulfate reductase cytochrome b subunit
MGEETVAPLVLDAFDPEGEDAVTPQPATVGDEPLDRPQPDQKTDAPETHAIADPTVSHEIAQLVSREIEPEPEPEKAAVLEPEPVTEIDVRAVYEHPLPVRICHWLNSVSLVVMAMSGLQIFLAFPSFGPKVPQNNFIDKLPSWLALGGWLGGALQWHFTFAWIYVATGIVYMSYQAISGNFHQMLFLPRDLPDLWPMLRHYFLFGPKPVPTGAYNALQKIAYTSAIFIGAFAFVTGAVLFNPVQFFLLTKLLGGFRLVRIWHFASLCMLSLFVAGHLVMVAIHGLNNFFSMLTGWKRDPEYLPTVVAKLKTEPLNENK